MAVTYGFYNSLNKDRVYNAEQMSAIFDGVITDGVFASIGGKLIPTAGTDMQVIVKTGKCWFNSTWTVNDSELPLSIPVADVSLTRIDAIVVEINSAVNTRANSIKVIRGTASANPAKPTLASSPTLHQYALGYVTVPANTTSISASNIEVNVGKSGCPFVTSILQQTNIDDLFNQWNSQFLMWFNNVQAQLSGNVAANLQAQIDAIAQNGYGKNGVVSSITANSGISELYSGLDAILNTMRNDEEKRFKLIAGSSVLNGGTYEGTLRKHSTGWATATLYGYWEKYPLVTLTRNGTDNIWYYQSIARRSDINAVGDIKLTQAKVDEGIWTKCDGRSLNANLAPLNNLNGVISGAAVEKIVTIEEVFGSKEGALNPNLYWYIGNKIAYIHMDGTNLKISFYDITTKKTTSKVIKASETGSKSPSMHSYNAFRANNRIFFSCELDDFLGVSNYAQCLFCSSDDGNTWQYIVTSTGQYYEKIVYSAQWCENIQKYIFQSRHSDTDDILSFIGNVEDGTFVEVGGTEYYKIAVFNPISQKYIKFYQVYDSSDSRVSRLYWYETTNINDNGSAASNSVLINTSTGTTSYNGQQITLINYAFDKTSNHLYLIADIEMTIGKNSHKTAKKIINVNTKTVSEITGEGVSVSPFGESTDSTAFECDTSNNVYYIRDLNNNSHLQILANRIGHAASTVFQRLDHYDIYKYLGYIYNIGFIFVSSPNAQNNKIILLPNCEQVQDAIYYMKIANEK